MSIVAQMRIPGKSLERGEQQRQCREALQEAINTAVRPRVVAGFSQALEAHVTTLIGRLKGRHRAGLTPAPTALHCPACGRQQTLDFVRKGHYWRTQLTLWGWLDIAVPRVECVCGHGPHIPFDILTAYDRVWSDLDALTIDLVAVAVSLRNICAVVRLQSGHEVSIGTVQRRVKRVAAIADWQMRQKVAVSPAVVILDALWGTIMVDTGERKRDKKGRVRRVKQGKKIPLLVALGLDPTTGETTLLAWVQGTAESVDDWTRLLTVLHGRGVHVTTGLRLFIHDGCAALESALDVVDFGPVRRQRCIFHKLRNVVRAVSGHEGMSREEKKERITAVLEDACAIYRAPTAAEARQRAVLFRERWGETEEKAVATLERDFEATLTYYDVCAEAEAEGRTWRVQYLRTTSLLEGENSSLRAKWRQARVFWSEEGQRGALWLVVQQRERQDKADRTLWLTSIMAGLLAPDEIEPNFPTP